MEMPFCENGGDARLRWIPSSCYISAERLVDAANINRPKLNSRASRIFEIACSGIYRNVIAIADVLSAYKMEVINGS